MNKEETRTSINRYDIDSHPHIINHEYYNSVTLRTRPLTENVRTW